MKRFEFVDGDGRVEVIEADSFNDAVIELVNRLGWGCENESGEPV